MRRGWPLSVSFPHLTISGCTHAREDPSGTSSIPSYLLSHAQARARKAAQLAAAAAAAAQTTKRATPSPATPSQPKPASAKPVTPAHTIAQTSQPNASTPKPPRKPKGGNHSAKADRPQGGVASVVIDFGRLADRVVEESADKEAALAIRPALPGMLEAMATGAAIPGSTGVADRAMMLRIMRHSSSTAREQAAAARQLGNAVGDRLVAALARREAASARVIEGQSEVIGRASVAEAERLDKIA